MNVRRLFVGVIALSLAASAAQAITAAGDSVLRGGLPCYCVDGGPNGDYCVLDFPCSSGAPICMADGSGCPPGTVPFLANCCPGAEGVCACVTQCPAESCVGAAGHAPNSCGVWPQCVDEPQGACCNKLGNCTEGTAADCAAIAGGVYQGDGTSCATADCPRIIPATSEWGLIVLAVIGLAVGTIVFKRRLQVQKA